MIVGPNHPMFNIRPDIRNEGGFAPQSILPPGAVPEGARFDHIHPLPSQIDPRNTRRNNLRRYFFLLI